MPLHPVLGAVALALALATSARAAPQTVWYVDDDASGANDGTSWADAFQLLQDALAVAGPQDEVWVAEGHYVPDQGGTATPGDRWSSFGLNKPARNYGGFAGYETSLDERAGLFATTVLDGDLAGDDPTGHVADNAYAVVSYAGTIPGQRIDGFTIRHGHNLGGNNLAGGIVGNYASGTIANCILEDNAGGLGGGLYLDDGAATVVDCVIRGNYAQEAGGGVYVSDDHRSVFVRCEVYDNEADYGGGIYVTHPGWQAQLQLVACRFGGNLATVQGGGAYVYGVGGSCADFVSCAFTGNHSNGAGGGLTIRYGTQHGLEGCTIYGNTSVVAPAGLLAIDATGGITHAMTFSGCIVRGNTVAGASSLATQLLLGPEYEIERSSIEHLDASIPGVGNIGADPLLVDPDGSDGVLGTADDDLSLSFGSPAIDAADGTAYPGEAIDLDGDGSMHEPVPVDLLGRSRFAPDVATPDSGVPAHGADIPDMGAVELVRRLPLEGHPAALSISAGGEQTLVLDAYDPLSNHIYAVLGSDAGTEPGTPAWGATLPLAAGAYLTYTMVHPGAPPLAGGVGVLDANGDAVATFSLPPGALAPSTAGLVLHHAYVVLSGVPSATPLAFVSNATPLELAP